MAFAEGSGILLISGDQVLLDSCGHVDFERSTCGSGIYIHKCIVYVNSLMNNSNTGNPTLLLILLSSTPSVYVSPIHRRDLLMVSRTSSGESDGAIRLPQSPDLRYYSDSSLHRH